MCFDGWKYYNHALVSDVAPHESPSLEIFDDKLIWKKSKALLAQWTENFDLYENAEWYYIIKDAPFDENQLSSKKRKHIRQAFKKVYVKKINPTVYAKDLAEVYNHACLRYECFSGVEKTPENFHDNRYDNRDFWGAFSVEENRLIGYMECEIKEKNVNTLDSKYHCDFLNLRASDALHYFILNYYLNEKNFRYVSSGNRSINHKTNVQNYKIENFGFRKAYCKLCVIWNPKIKWVIKFLYPLRSFFLKFDKVSFVHKINGVLKLEYIVRNQRL